MLRHVNNVVLQHYYDLGKLRYSSDIIEVPHLTTDDYFTTAATRTDYFEEVRMDDDIFVTTKVVKVGTKSITLEQEIVDRNSKVVKSRSETVLVGFNLIRRESIEIKPEWREKIYRHEDIK